MRAVAERLVLRAAASTKSEMLCRSTLAACCIEKIRCAHDDVRPVPGNKHGWFAFPVSMLDTGEGIAQGSRRALPNGRYGFITTRAARVDPRLLLQAKDRRKSIGAAPGMCANASVVVNRDALAFVILALVIDPPFLFG